MINSNLIKTGLGVGLLAASLGASAGALDGSHGFGNAMIYVSGGTAPVYQIFMPSGTGSTDNVILVEATQGATAATMTWTYMVGTSSLGAQTANAGASYSALSSAAGVYLGAAGSTSAAVEFHGMNTTGAISYPFSYSAGSGASICNINLSASIGVDDHLVWTIISAAPTFGGWSSASGVVSVTRNSTVGLETYAAAVWNSPSASTQFVTTGVVAANASISIPGNAAATGTLAVGNILKAANYCGTYTAKRKALNSSGLLLGGSAGMIRLW